MSNPFDSAIVAQGYEDWYAGSGRRAVQLEKRLLAGLMAVFPQTASVLEVGCGTGHFTRWLAERGFVVVGLDRSPSMLAEARKYHRQRYLLGDALALPWDDGAFDILALITTLEFVSDPRRALEEAVRVARTGLVLGVLNRCSLLALRRKIIARPPWPTARFFSPVQLARLVRDCAGARLLRIRWRTTLGLLSGFGCFPLPWGAFIGMRVQLRPIPKGQKV